MIFIMFQISTYIAHPTSAWIDDYFDWLRPGGDPPCCRVYNGSGDFCAATGNNML